MTFDYVAMENGGRLAWDRMPDGVREMICEAERLGAQVEVSDLSGNWRPAPNNVTRCIFPYRIVNWRAPGDRQEPPKAAVILGRVVEAGNVACLDGKPGLVIETTEARLRGFGRNVIGCEVEVGVRADSGKE